MDGTFIQEYQTTWEVKQQTGVSQDAISSAINKNDKAKTAGGFIWIKSNEYYNPNFVFNKQNYINTRLKAVIQLDLNGKYINTFESCAAAERAMGRTGNVISACCRGDVSTAYGYLWVFAVEYDQNIDYSIHRKPTWNQYAVIQLDRQFNFIAEFPSVNEAHKQTNISIACICDCCNGIQKKAGGFLWLKKEDYLTILLNGYDIREMYYKIKNINKDDVGPHICDYEGVHWNKRRRKWEAKIVINGNAIILGLFDDMQEAINARKSAEIEKEFKNTNKSYKLQMNNKSGCAGVCWDKKHNRWMSTLTHNGTIYYLGRFFNKEDAIRARLEAEAKYFGEFAPQHHLFKQYGITIQNKCEEKHEKEMDD